MRGEVRQTSHCSVRAVQGPARRRTVFRRRFHRDSKPLLPPQLLVTHDLVRLEPGSSEDRARAISVGFSTAMDAIVCSIL